MVFGQGAVGQRDYTVTWHKQLSLFDCLPLAVTVHRSRTTPRQLHFRKIAQRKFLMCVVLVAEIDRCTRSQTMEGNSTEITG